MKLACIHMLSFTKIHDKNGGFLVNGEVKVVVEVDSEEDVPMEYEITNKPQSKIEQKNGPVSSVFLKEASAVMESIDVNRFQVYPSQVESVRRIFERHPDLAVGFRSKNQHLRNACMSSLLALVETLCQSLQELSTEDLVEADIALKFVKDAGFKVDWLEENLEQVKEKKAKELSGLAMLQETEEKLLKLKQKSAELEALANEMEAIVNEQKAELSVTRTPLSFDDVV